ncbi:MAG: hypothetical protein H0V62_11180 [Gammaproteobacteria bacterium]|nr:hypothetical protein [Gammaproteobacteria bacterium]
MAPLLGLPATLRLVEAFGGTCIWIPRACHARHPLVRQLGRVAADIVSAHCGLQYFGVPRAVATTTAADLAREYSLTERRVWAIVAARVPATERQAALF